MKIFIFIIYSILNIIFLTSRANGSESVSTIQEKLSNSIKSLEVKLESKIFESVIEKRNGDFFVGNKSIKNLDSKILVFSDEKNIQIAESKKRGDVYQEPRQDNKG